METQAKGIAQRPWDLKVKNANSVVSLKVMAHQNHEKGLKNRQILKPNP